MKESTAFNTKLFSIVFVFDVEYLNGESVMQAMYARITVSGEIE